MLDRGVLLADVPMRALKNWLQHPAPTTKLAAVVSGEPLTLMEHRFLDLVDLVHGLIYVVKKAHFKDVGPPPEPLPRPQRAPSGGLSFSQVDALIAEREASQGARTFRRSVV